MKATTHDNLEVWLERRTSGGRAAADPLTLAAATDLAADVVSGPGEWERVEEKAPRFAQQNGQSTSTLMGGFELEEADISTHDFRVCVQRGQRQPDSWQGDLQVAMTLDQQPVLTRYIEGNDTMCTFDLWTEPKLTFETLLEAVRQNIPEAAPAFEAHAYCGMSDEDTNILLRDAVEDLGSAEQSEDTVAVTAEVGGADAAQLPGIDCDLQSVQSDKDRDACGKSTVQETKQDSERALVLYQPPRAAQMVGLNAVVAKGLSAVPREALLPPADPGVDQSPDLSGKEELGLELAEPFKQLFARPIITTTEANPLVPEQTVLGGDEVQRVLPPAPVIPVPGEVHESEINTSLPAPPTPEHNSLLLLDNSAEDQLRTLTIDIYRGHKHDVLQPVYPDDSEIDFDPQRLITTTEWDSWDPPGSPWCRFIYQFGSADLWSRLTFRVDDEMREEVTLAEVQQWEEINQQYEAAQKRLERDEQYQLQYDAAEKARLEAEAEDAAAVEKASQEKEAKKQVKGKGKEKDKAPSVKAPKASKAPPKSGTTTKASTGGDSTKRSGKVTTTAEPRASSEILVPATPPRRHKERHPEVKKAAGRPAYDTSRFRSRPRDYDRISHFDPIAEEGRPYSYSPPRRSRTREREREQDSQRVRIGDYRHRETEAPRDRGRQDRIHHTRPISDKRAHSPHFHHHHHHARHRHSDYDSRRDSRSPARHHRERTASSRPTDRRDRDRDPREGRGQLYRIPFDPGLSHLTRRRQSDGPGAYGLPSPSRRPPKRRRSPDPSLEGEDELDSESEEDVGPIEEQGRAFEARDRDRAIKRRKEAEKEARRQERRRAEEDERDRELASRARAQRERCREDERRSARSVTPVKHRPVGSSERGREELAARSARAASHRADQYRAKSKVIDLTHLDDSD